MVERREIKLGLFVIHVVREPWVDWWSVVFRLPSDVHEAILQSKCALFSADTCQECLDWCQAESLGTPEIRELTEG